MGIRKTLTSIIVGGLRHVLGVVPVESLTQAESDDLRILARLYQIIDREPVFAAALEFVLSSSAEHFSRRQCSTLVRTILCCLLKETGRRFHGIGQADRAEEVFQVAAAVRPGNSDRIVACLLLAIAEQRRLHSLRPLVVDAILRALLSEVWHTSRRTDRAAVLSAVAWAAFTTGARERLRSVTRQLATVVSSPGDSVLLAFYEAKVAAGDGRNLDEEDAMARFLEAATTLPRSDPSYKDVLSLAALELRSRAISDHYRPDEASAIDRAAEAMRRQHWGEAARQNEQVLRGRQDPAGRAKDRALAELSRLLDGQLQTSARLDACIDRLVADDLLASRSKWSPGLGIEEFLVKLLGQAVEVYMSGDHAVPVTRITDLMGEFRGGAAVGRRPGSTFSRGDALADLALTDLLSQETVALSAQEVVSCFPDLAVLWVNLLNSDDGFVVVTSALQPGSPTPIVRRTLLDASGAKALAGSMGQRSEQIESTHLSEIAQLIFADLKPLSENSKMLVVPDSAAWDMPWSELVPPEVPEYAITISMASAARLRQARPSKIPRVVGVFDDALPGARIEAAKLHELRTLGTIKFVQATSLAQLDEALHSATFDLLTVAVHGASGDGFEYRFLLPDGPSSPSALLRMPLPPTVVLGSCWSAASAVHQDTVAAALACLATGASRVIGGLWAIDDSVAGKLLARTYESHFAGVPLPRAFRHAHLSLEAAERRQAAGLTLIGRA